MRTSFVVWPAWCGAVLLSVCVCGTTWAATPAATLNECNDTTPQVLQAQALSAPATQARAAWLDARTLRWAGVPADGAYRLHASSSGRLSVSDELKVQGADSSWPLEPVAPAPETEDSRRFSHITAGLTARLSDEHARQLPTLLQQQVLLTREDPSGHVLDATQVQLAGALDAIYSGAAQAQDLGARLHTSSTSFKVWAPTAQKVHLCLFGSDDHGTGSAVDLVALHRDETTGVWAAKLPQALNGVHYAFLVDVHVRGVGRVRQRASDPYALALNADSALARVVDLNDATLKPKGWASTPQIGRAHV